MDKRHYFLLSAILVLLAGCNTPQQRAYNTPKPIPPPQQSQSSSSSSGGQPAAAEQATEAAGAQQAETESTNSDSAQADNNSADQQACAPQTKPSSPDVEIIDVPLDENGNPIEPVASTTSPTAPASDECQTAQSSQTSQSSSSSQQNKQAAAQNKRSGGAAAGGIAKAQTTEEKGAAASNQLNERLAAFDEMMRRARDEAARERQAGAGRPSGALGGLGANQNTPDAERGAGGQADSSSGAGHTPDRSGTNRPADYQHAATGPIPANLPDARDDDIVARQLREAATKESDPVLREKLWDEYRRYKNGL